MALDGLVVSNIKHELSTLLIGGRIDKIAQPEKDEIIITVRNNRVNYKLLMTIEASMPRIHITTLQKSNPLTPPNFCMVLRKHINNGKIISISQPNFERIIEIEIQHRDELGDLASVYLIIEIMGRHSNIILLNKNRMILDSAKHVNSFMSSVREVLPGRDYVPPPSKDKKNPLLIQSRYDFIENLIDCKTIHEALIKSFNGISSLVAEEICYRASLNSSANLTELSVDELDSFYEGFNRVISAPKTNAYTPNILQKENGDYKDFSCLKLSTLKGLASIEYSSISELLDIYYKNKSIKSRVSQKSTDIRKLIQNNIDRCKRKLSLQLKQIEDTKDKDKFKILGELINANIYNIKLGDEKVEVFNYYTNENQVIKLDPYKTPTQNAQIYYNKYNKKKRTFIALTDLVEETKKELNHLESIQYSLDYATNAEDLQDIRDELVRSNYIRFRKTKGKASKKKSNPLHYVSSSGYHMYVGKNNLQNDELSLKFANGNDWWFHTKAIPGSHVIVKSQGEELPDKVFEEAAALAAYYSKGKNDSKVAVDYTLKKHLKKPNGSVPGYVIYHTNYSMIATPSIENLTFINE